MPAIVIAPGRSPRPTATRTGIATAQTAVVGATTAMTPIASARYRSATPAPPVRPAAAPHRKSARVGVAVGRKGSMTNNSTRPGKLRHDNDWERAGALGRETAEEVGSTIADGGSEGEYGEHSIGREVVRRPSTGERTNEAVGELRGRHPVQCLVDCDEERVALWRRHQDARDRKLLLKDGRITRMNTQSKEVGS